MSGGCAGTIRRHCLELWQGLGLHGIGKSTFQHLTVKWKVASVKWKVADVKDGETHQWKVENGKRL